MWSEPHFLWKQQSPEPSLYHAFYSLADLAALLIIPFRRYNLIVISSDLLSISVCGPMCVNFLMGVGLGVSSTQVIILSLSLCTATLVFSNHGNISNKQNTEQKFQGKWTHPRLYKNKMISSICICYSVYVVSTFIDNAFSLFILSGFSSHISL